MLNAQGDDGRMRNMENRITALECRKNCCTIVNPPARPFAKDCWGMFVFVDPLLWQAHENGLGLGIRTTNNPNLFNSSGESRVRNLHFDWDWGFRLGAGLNWDYDGWDTRLVWTRWHTSAHKHLVAGQNQSIYPEWLNPNEFLAATAANATGNWKLHLNMLDLENGREFFVSKYLTIRPHVGLRSAWINQKFNVSYFNLENSPLLEPGATDHLKLEYWGLGLRGGVDTQWGLGCGFSLFGNFAASLLQGYFKVDANEYSIDADGIRTINFQVDDFYHIGRGITDMSIGLRYDWVSCDECYHFGVEGGWEHHMFWGQNQFMLFVDDGSPAKYVANHGDLSTQGYYIRLRFDF